MRAGFGEPDVVTTPAIRSPVSGPGAPRDLSVARGAALYVGALVGPGLLLLPGLAAAQAGPASVLAWFALLVVSALIAVVFTALGKARASAGGVTGYAAAGLGPRAGTAVGWCFLAGVVCGAPIVCLICANYVTDLTGGGHAARCAVAAALLLVVLGLALGGVRATTTVQLTLVALLIGAIAGSVAGSAPSARAGNWIPFAPHGWTAIGHAAATLMLSFVGWEAVAPLTARFKEPSRQLPRVIAIAFAVTTAIYLGLAVATVAVLGTGAGTDVPLAALLVDAIGAPGRAAAAVLAVILTLGAVNAYLAGAIAVARNLAPARAGLRTDHAFLAVIALAGLFAIGLYALHLLDAAQLVGLPSALFLAVYLGCMASAARTLTGAARRAAVPAVIAVAAVMSFCGWAVLVVAAVSGTAALTGPRRSWPPGNPGPLERPDGSGRGGHPPAA